MTHLPSSKLGVRKVRVETVKSDTSACLPHTVTMVPLTKPDPDTVTSRLPPKLPVHGRDQIR